ncbi:MAG: hypothetical protein JWQ81_1892 [Amycolatopsis sp.]|jgi:hypothetical protein|uniref:hypothetical protein n=1 Tax=Amycolatopsis sp. TaxID=37632 RepID=UPI00260AEF33|nr:hypothetical protein [Amycolatopsis sp.]MCU1681153.1 hypothetical protein [Amycolatopsis sp.]
MNKVEWSDEVQNIMVGDLTAAISYLTPAGGAVVTTVSPLGIVDRAAGTVGFTTSLGFGKKLEHILRNPRMAICYHARDHGFSTSSSLVLVQGHASVKLTPSPERLDALEVQMARYLGEAPSGRVWDWILREYHQERVVVDIQVDRVTTWPDLSAAGARSTGEPAWPTAPDSQPAPAKGTGPRVDIAKIGKRLRKPPHRLLAFQGADGYPVVVPVGITGQGPEGVQLEAPEGLLPEGARRAGLVTHQYNAKCVGLTVCMCTGWLEVSGNGARYAPHTFRVLSAPPMKNLMMLANGLAAKHGLRQARRNGTVESLAKLAAGTRETTA